MLNLEFHFLYSSLYFIDKTKNYFYKESNFIHLPKIALIIAFAYQYLISDEKTVYFLYLYSTYFNYT